MKHALWYSLATLTLTIGAFVVGAKYYYYFPFYTYITQAGTVIHPTKGNTVHGTVTFVEESTGTTITAHLEGLTPGEHGFHIHEFGDCMCDDAVCAGDHFNPTKQPHGALTDAHRHVGDLGNITADDEGNATYTVVDPYIKLNGPHSIIGRTVIIHAHQDDYVSQPSGNAGARIGCGVIGLKK